MVVKIRRWGNSLALRLPKAVALGAGFSEGSSVEVVASEGTIVVRAQRRYRLADLLEGVSTKNVHAEIPSGKPAGREAW